MTISTRSIFFSLLLSGSFVGGQARAQQILSYVVETPDVAAESGSYTNWSHNLALPSFDSALGTLTNVALSYTSVVLQTARGENFGAGEGVFSYNITTSMAVDWMAGANLFTLDQVTLAGSGNSASFDGTIDLAGASGFTFTHTITSTSLLESSDPGFLAAFAMPVSVDFVATATATAMISGSGQFIGQTISKASGALAVEYTFTPVPEPSAYALVIAVTGFGLALWRRRGGNCLVQSKKLI